MTRKQAPGTSRVMAIRFGDKVCFANIPRREYWVESIDVDPIGWMVHVWYLNDDGKPGQTWWDMQSFLQHALVLP